jgi:protease I
LLYDDPDHLNLASSARDQDVIVGAICLAPKILANAGILEGKNATVFPDSESIAYLESKGATYTEEEVPRDGNIITASGPEASEAFADAVVAAAKEGRV